VTITSTSLLRNRSSQDRTARTWLPEQDSQDWADCKEQPWGGCQEGTSMTDGNVRPSSGQECHNKITRCEDNLSTDKPTTRQFDPHYPSTQRTVSCDNSPLWHSYTHTIRPGIFCPPRLRGGWFVTCNMISTPYFLSCDIMSTLSCPNLITLGMDSQSDRTDVHQPIDQMGIFAWVGRLMFCLNDHIQG
jgi:hypothetical protein